MEIATMVLRHWRLIAGLPILLAVAVGVWTLSQERSYVASASFMPAAPESGGLRGAAAIAQQFGVDLGDSQSGYSPDFYVDLLRRRALLRQAVETQYEVPTSDGLRAGDLIQWFGIGGGGLIPPWRQAVEELRARLSVSVGRQAPVVDVRVSADHPVLAEEIVQRLLNLLHEFNVEVRQSRALEEGRFIAGRLQDAHGELVAAEQALQAFLNQNREFTSSPALMFEHDRLQRQVGMRQEIYTSLLRSREQAQIEAVRDTHLFVVIDPPAAGPEGRGVVLRVLLAAVLGLVLAVLLALASEVAARVRQTDGADYRELRGLLRQVGRDVRTPLYWFRRRPSASAAPGPGGP